MAEQSFAPITTDPLAISFPDDYIRERSERSRPSRNFLALLRDPSFNSYVPYAWGFTIYRVRFEGDSDDRFAKALRLFSKWTQWLVRASKFTEEGTRNLFPADVPVPSDDPTDDLADRLYNQVIEVYPNANSIVTGPEGEEDFSAVGEAFTKWVDALGIDLTLSKNNTRYDQCLIIDKQALETLERLPEDLPPLRSERISHPKCLEVNRIYNKTWVWILDRKTYEAYSRGDKVKYPPWIRLRIMFLLECWFGRSDGSVSLDWNRVVEEDLYKWETVRWWSPGAIMMNRICKEMRDAGEIPAQPAQVEG